MLLAGSSGVYVAASRPNSSSHLLILINATAPETGGSGRLFSLFIVLRSTSNELLHLAGVHGFHLFGAQHLRVLQVAKEVCNLSRQQTICIKSSLLLLLLFDLKSVDLFLHARLQL